MKAGNPTRIIAIDLARGIAISLMILSHGVKGLLSFEQFPAWGLVPIHLITKFSSTIFFLVFGLSLAVSFAPATLDPRRWPRKRNKLLLRGLVIFFWYKALTVLELSHLHGREEILDALLYRSFPSYSEILGFYAIALLWIPFALPLWQKSALWLKGLWPLGLAALAFGVGQVFDFGASEQLKAILVEEQGYYTWGQLSRAPIVFLGMLIGHFLLRDHHSQHSRRRLAGSLTAAALVLFGGFYLLHQHQLMETFVALAKNQGKHPPDLSFLLFSFSGAFLTLGLCIAAGARGARWLAPLTLIGRDTLTAFVFHISVLFVFYRYLFDLWLKVTYPQALGLAVLLIALTAVWIKLNFWRKKYETAQASHELRAPPPGPHTLGPSPGEGRPLPAPQTRPRGEEVRLAEGAPPGARPAGSAVPGAAGALYQGP